MFCMKLKCLSYPEVNENFSLKQFVNSIANKQFETPSTQDIVNITQIVGKVEDGVNSLVCIGNIANVANISIVYEKSQSREVVAFLADVKLSDRVQTGTGIDISNVPLFRYLIVPDISYTISSTKFSTMNLPNLEIDNVPSKIFLETIAKGVTGQMNINLDEIAEMSAHYAENKLRIEPLTSLALIDLLTILPDMETVIDSLPPVVKDIRYAIITGFLYTPACLW